jgi:hypothetical protein
MGAAETRRRCENVVWKKTWESVDRKYRQDHHYNVSELEVKIEGAFVLMGLLYGNGGLDSRMVISCRCGSDSDYNHSSSCGVLFTTRGLSRLPDRYYRRLNEQAIFSRTAYSLPKLICVCGRLDRQAPAKAGGPVEKDASGEDVSVIPRRTPVPGKFEDLKNPSLIASSAYSEDDKARIQPPPQL